MKPSSKAQNNGEKPNSWLDLDLPVDPGFISETPKLTADQLFRINMAQMKFLNSRPGAEEQRLREKCNVPFEL